MVDDVSQREWTSTWQLENVFRGRIVLSEVQEGILEVWREIEHESVGLQRVERE